MKNEIVTSISDGATSTLRLQKAYRWMRQISSSAKISHTQMREKFENSNQKLNLVSLGSIIAEPQTCQRHCSDGIVAIDRIVDFS